LLDTESIVRIVERTVGDVPIILCGSRATGTATETSDYDLFVVIPMYRIPYLLKRLRHAEIELEKDLRAAVSLNPLPPFRLRHPGPTLMPWKIRREGSVLRAPRRFQLGTALEPPTPLSEPALRSYGVTGLIYLIENLNPSALLTNRLPLGLSNDIRKALLHGVQLQILRRGQYASTLQEAYGLMDATSREVAKRLANSLHDAATWFGVRDLLCAELDRYTTRKDNAVLLNAQYLALSILKRRAFNPTALLQRKAIAETISEVVILLAASVTPSGFDANIVSRAWHLLPRFLAPKDPSWTSVRDVALSEWPYAHPLVGF
jgi:hypothetical protein